MTLAELSLRIRKVVIPGKDHTQPVYGDCKVQIWNPIVHQWVDMRPGQVNYDPKTETIRLG